MWELTGRVTQGEPVNSTQIVQKIDILYVLLITYYYTFENAAIYLLLEKNHFIFVHYLHPEP